MERPLFVATLVVGRLQLRQFRFEHRTRRDYNECGTRHHGKSLKSDRDSRANGDLFDVS
jgi:hypothetical protein